MRKYLWFFFCLFTGIFSLPSAAQAASSVSDLRKQHEQALALLQQQVANQAGDQGRRNSAIFALAQRAGKIPEEADLEWLEQYRPSSEEDRFAKIYAGYGWLRTADRYMQQQNYFRAAELAKRGFFLVDEVVDTHHDDWRLRLLRVRMDAFLPPEFGRYVIALDDLKKLEQEPRVPRSIKPVLTYLAAQALNSAGQPDAANEALQALQGSALENSPLQGDGLFLTPAEIVHVLQPALEISHE